MGLLVNGEWHTDWYDTKATGGRFERKAPVFVTGLQQMAVQGLRALAALKQNLIVITYMYHWRVHGPIAP